MSSSYSFEGTVPKLRSNNSTCFAASESQPIARCKSRVTSEQIGADAARLLISQRLGDQIIDRESGDDIIGIGDIEVGFIDRPDALNASGVKGAGEVAMVGAAAAIANAVFHATGKRMRGLPIRIENLL